MNLRKLRFWLLLYVAFDLWIGGYCGGFLPLTPAAAAQFTQVSGTVVDPNGLPYAAGNITPTLVISGTPTFTATGFAYTPPTGAVGLDLTGTFVMQLADVTALSPGGATWSFQVCSGAGTVLPSGGKGPLCFNVTGLTISGASQNIGATLNLSALALTFNPGSGTTTGTGTANTLTKWSGPATQTNSSISDTGSAVSTSLPFSASTLSSTGAGSGTLSLVQGTPLQLCPTATPNCIQANSVNFQAPASVPGNPFVITMPGAAPAAAGLFQIGIKSTSGGIDTSIASVSLFSDSGTVGSYTGTGGILATAGPLASGTNGGTGGSLVLNGATSGSGTLSVGATGNSLISGPNFQAPKFTTSSNCQLGGASGTTSPAACGSASAGAVAIPASQTSYTVNTTNVSANSHIIVQQITDNSGIATATCNSGATVPVQTSRVAATSFTITLTSVASVTCIQYWIVD